MGDIKLPEYEQTATDQFELLDLRRWAERLQAVRGIEEVYNLAADMGGIGFIESHKAQIMHNSVLINMHMLEAARVQGAERVLFTSSACIHPGYKQNFPDVTPLKEADAYPVDAEDGHGWEKLFTERQCRHNWEDYGLKNRCAQVPQPFFDPWGSMKEAGRRLQLQSVERSRWPNQTMRSKCGEMGIIQDVLLH